jgi:hypothetical protein
MSETPRAASGSHPSAAQFRGKRRRVCWRRVGAPAESSDPSRSHHPLADRLNTNHTIRQPGAPDLLRPASPFAVIVRADPATLIRRRGAEMICNRSGTDRILSVRATAQGLARRRPRTPSGDQSGSR